MRMTDATMYARVLASDASSNGRFFFGVTSTGIYCLPSCRSRKPKRENTLFFPSCESARAAGLRACRKCHPDDFARGADPVLETIENLVAEVRSHPETFPDVATVVRRSGFGATRLFELFRQHYHRTPADLLLRARLDRAKAELQAGKATLLEISEHAGFESLSTFHENFHALNGLTPTHYRDLPSSRRFELALPRDYALNYLKRALSRDTQSLTERLEGPRFTTTLNLKQGPALLELQLGSSAVTVNVSGGSAADAHAPVLGLLGLDEDSAGFVRLAKRLGLARLVAGRAGLRISQTLSVFDGLVWAVIGQQINFAFACTLRRRLTELVGAPVGEGLYRSAQPAAVAALRPADLLPLQFSRQKADYLISTARLVASGALDLEAMRGMSATRAERTLLAVRGLGPWSVNYVMMRSLGFPDCLPIGDTGVTSGLQALLKLEERPDADATRRLMSVFSPYRSLATTHLWQFTKPLPT